jgi:hypothetical protein
LAGLEGPDLPDLTATIAYVACHGEDISGYHRPGIHRHVAVYGGEIPSSSEYIRVAPDHEQRSPSRSRRSRCCSDRRGPALPERSLATQCPAVPPPGGRRLEMIWIAQVRDIDDQTAGVGWRHGLWQPDSGFWRAQRGDRSCTSERGPAHRDSVHPAASLWRG